MAAVASATPSIKPTDATLAPRLVTRNTGSRLWILSGEISMKSETKPRAITVRGSGLFIEVWRAIPIPYGRFAFDPGGSHDAGLPERCQGRRNQAVCDVARHALRTSDVPHNQVNKGGRGELAAPVDLSRLHYPKTR